MKLLFLAFASAAFASCASPNSDFVDQRLDAEAIPHADWKRIDSHLRSLAYPRPAAGVLAEFDRESLAKCMISPALGETRQFSILHSDPRRYICSIGLTLDRRVPPDADRFAAILCGEAPDPQHTRISSIEILGMRPGQEIRIGNNLSVLFRSE